MKQTSSKSQTSPDIIIITGLSGSRDDVSGQRAFEDLGYFCVDKDSPAKSPVFNRAVTLRDSWAKIEKSQQKK